MRRLLRRLLAHAERLRFPKLFLLTSVLFVADLFYPDLIPLVDELLLGLGTATLGAWRRERKERKEIRAAEDAPDEEPSPDGGPPPDGRAQPEVGSDRRVNGGR